jgi:UDP-N-acetylglucosamine diphosphorylase/glucosamine-1-phosphate N-acetyltransferase
MRICVYEDSRWPFLDPLTLTRPAFDLVCGSCTLLERQKRAFAATEIGLCVRPDLVSLCRLRHPGLPVNDSTWLRQSDTVLVNGRWLPPEKMLADLQQPGLAVVGEEVAFAILPWDAMPAESCDGVENRALACKNTLPHFPAGGTMIAYAWDLVERNPTALAMDVAWQKAQMGAPSPPANLTVVGSTVDVVVHREALIDPFVVADSRGGPVLIDRGAVVHSFSRLEGPCYVGPGSWIMGAKLRGGTIGPCCRVGGEVEASILHGHVNKYHDGFLGHSYLGEWVNLAAGTQVSDLRNDYGEVSVTVAGERIDTGLAKVGAFLGDQTRTGIGALLNTGTVAGVFCNLLPTGALLPRVFPSFSANVHGQFQERSELWELFRTAAKAMARRGQPLTDAHTDFYFSLYDQTSAFRRRALRESEQKRLRRSVSS